MQTLSRDAIGVARRRNQGGIPLRHDHGLSELYALHGARLVAAARAILHSDDLARDAVQEALVSCWRSRRAPDDALAWLLRTVVHRALHHARSRRRRSRHEEHAARSRDERLAPRVTAHDLRELGGVLTEALCRLPAPHRDVFLAYELDGLDYREIATRSGVRIGTVRSRLSRARESLRAALGPTLARDPWCLDCAREEAGRSAR